MYSTGLGKSDVAGHHCLKTNVWWFNTFIYIYKLSNHHNKAFWREENFSIKVINIDTGSSDNFCKYIYIKWDYTTILSGFKIFSVE